MYIKYLKRNHLYTCLIKSTCRNDMNPTTTSKGYMIYRYNKIKAHLIITYQCKN